MSKRWLLVLGMCFVTAVAAMAADPVEGFWKSVDEDGKATAFWRIYVRNDTLFGEIVKIVGRPDDTIATAARPSYRDFPVAGQVNTMRVIGTPWIYGLRRRTTGQWEGGNIVDPGKGDIYRCRIRFRAADGSRNPTDVLEVRGEIGLGIGRSQFWLRAKESEFR